MEKLMAVLENGPYPGDYILPKDQEWPPPEEILPVDKKKQRMETGKYVKVSQSKGPAKDGELRGARYKWQEFSKESQFDLKGFL